MSSTSRSSSKRPRTPLEVEQAASKEVEEISEIERSPKVPCHRPEVQSPCSSTTEDELPLEQLPLAIKLKDYLAPGGTLRYRPRPEWYQSNFHLPQNNTNPFPAIPDGQLGHVASSVSRDLSEAGGSRSDDDDHHRRANHQVEDNSSSSGEAAHGSAPADGLLPGDAFPDFMLPTRTAQVALSRRVTVTTLTSHQNSEYSPKVALATPPANSRPSKASKQSNKNINTAAPKPAVFGKDWDHALHVAIRENATAAAIALMDDYGVSVHVENAKRFTPLILAAQKGNLVLVRELLQRGADPAHTTSVGMSAVLQAAHFGRYQVLKLLLQHPCHTSLIEISNYNRTTPLMRASQEGHVRCVRLLLQAGADTNRRNRADLTALMLASQRGHARVCRWLVQYGACLDARTLQNSTSLLLACKRGHVTVVKELVTAGCELAVQDSRGRTARDVAMRYGRRRENETNENVKKQLLLLLDPAMQIDLMQHQGRRQRNFEMIRMWHLLQQARAHVLYDHPDMNIHAVVNLIENQSEGRKDLPYDLAIRSTTALLKTMTLPEPLVETITQFLPLPHLWEKRLGLLYRRAAVNADDAVMGSLDLIDEILEEGGFLDACDEARVTPMPHFESWAQWKAWGRQKGVVASEANNDSVNSTTGLVQRRNLITAECPPPVDMNRPTFTEMRRQAGFLLILAHRSPLLERVLVKSPYKMPAMLITKLINVSDVASLTRRMGTQGVHFDFSVALDLVSLVSNLCAWYWRERDSVF